MMRPGETFIWGNDKATARALLSAAERVGLDPSHTVLFTGQGFRVPNAVADEAAEDLAADSPVPNDPATTF